MVDVRDKHCIKQYSHTRRGKPRLLSYPARSAVSASGASSLRSLSRVVFSAVHLITSSPRNTGSSLLLKADLVSKTTMNSHHYSRSHFFLLLVHCLSFPAAFLVHGFFTSTTALLAFPPWQYSVLLLPSSSFYQWDCPRCKPSHH